MKSKKFDFKNLKNKEKIKIKLSRNLMIAMEKEKTIKQDSFIDKDMTVEFLNWIPS
jgi:hypothetical protein